MVQYVAGGRPASLVVPPQRLSPSRASAPGLLANTHNKPLQYLPGRSLGPNPPTMATRRLLPAGHCEREYVVSLSRHSEWPMVDVREQEEFVESIQESKTRPELRIHQGACRRQGARPHSGPRAASDRRNGDRSNSPSPRILPPTTSHASSAGLLRSPRGSKKEDTNTNSRDTKDGKGQFDQLAAMFQKSFSDKVANAHPPLTSPRPPSHSPGRGSKPGSARAGSLPSSAPRARSGSPSSARRVSPVKAPGSPRVSSPRSPAQSPRSKGNNFKSKSPQQRTRKGSDSVLCPAPRPISGTRSPGPAETSAPPNPRSSWPRRTSAPSSPACSSRSTGSTAMIVPPVKGSSPRLARHTLQPTRSTQASSSPSNRLLPGKVDRVEALSTEKGDAHKDLVRSSVELSSPNNAAREVEKAPPASPGTPQPDDILNEVELSDCIYSEDVQEWPTATAASPEVQRPALREIQPQAVLARSHAKEKESQGNPAKPAWQSSAPNVRHLASHDQAMQRVLVRTEECRKLETLEEPVSTPRREQVQSTLMRTPCGRGLSQRLVPLSSSTQSTWSLCNSEDSPSTWSAGFGSGSGIVTDLEEGDQAGFSLARGRISHGSSKAGEHGCSKESPPSPSTPFFGKASALDADVATYPQEPPTSVVADTCARVLYELRRNTSLIRLTCDEEIARRNTSTRDRERRTYEL